MKKNITTKPSKIIEQTKTSKTTKSTKSIETNKNKKIIKNKKKRKDNIKVIQTLISKNSMNCKLKKKIINFYKVCKIKLL